MLFGKIFRRILKTFWYRAYHHEQIRQWERRVKPQILSISKKENLQLLSINELAKHKTSDTLFVLGSGSSINNLKAKHWSKIKEHDSIGFNFWLIHDFIPTFYVYENILEQSRSHVFKHNLNQKTKAYKNVIFIRKSIRKKNIEDIVNFPPSLKRNLRLSQDLIIPGTNPSQFKKSIKMIEDKLEQYRESNILFRKGASLSYILFLGLYLKYKKIVLCGVDLNNIKYFFEENKDLYEKKGLLIPESIQNNSIHATINPAVKGITIDRVIDYMTKTAFAGQEITVYIASKESLLYPNLPKYFSTV